MGQLCSCCSLASRPHSSCGCACSKACVALVLASPAAVSCQVSRGGERGVLLTAPWSIPPWQHLCGLTSC